MDLNLKNKRALVIASSDGIGRAIAHELSKENGREWVLLLRLPLQGVLMAWAHGYPR